MGIYFVHRMESHIISSFFFNQLVNVLYSNWNMFGANHQMERVKGHKQYFVKTNRLLGGHLSSKGFSFLFKSSY